METFLASMKAVIGGDQTKIAKAISTLDLSEMSSLVRDEKGRDLVWILNEVIDRTRVPDTKRFTKRTKGDPYVFQTYAQGKLAIVFKENEGWRFGVETVEALPAILDELVEQQKAEGVQPVELSHLPFHLRLRSQLPPALKATTLILEHWQWLGILLIILLGVVLDKLVSMLLSLGVRVWRDRFATGSYREVTDSILRPLGLMAMAFVWWAGLNMLGLPAKALVILLVSVKFLACLSTVWGAFRLVDLLGAFLKDKALGTETKLDDALVPLVTKTMKVFVTVMGVVFIADNLDIDVTSLLAGLGLGGLAFALAAKDVAGNLFGSITVLLDQTFHVGDWVIIGDVEGTVERIGFRSTRVRTFYNSLVSVPNSNLITASVDNMGSRQFRRLSCKLSITYDTPPERIEAFCEGIRELVRQHPYMRKDYYHVYFNEFADASLNILVYVFWKVPDWATELRERHRFLLDCLRLAKRLGIEYAYPTQTVYLKQAEPGPQAPEEGVFQPAITEDNAMALGRDEAKAIVAATTGLDVVPRPVSFGGGDADDKA
ncbi:MAG: mechanosensitive ion channel family protein [Gammaproteobacteria bacterium]|nr:mechanosensitive ion channel family protein [Gammaproteobacteria bacterium]